MDRLDAMAVLVAAADAGSLSAGARRLRMPLTTVSRTIAGLEQRLATRLLVRTSRRVELTDAGRTYVAAARRILEQVGEAERVAAGEYHIPRGLLVVTAPVVFGRRHVLPVAAEFLAAHGEIDLRLWLADGRVNLVDEHIDAALRIGRLADSALVAARVGSVRRVVCGSPDYFARRGTPQTPADLAAHEAVTFQGAPAAPEWQFGPAANPAAAAIRTRLTVNTAEAAVDAALAGLGLTRVLSYQVAEQVRSGALAIVLAEFEPEPLPVSLVHAPHGSVKLKLRAFLDWAAPRLRSRLAALP